MPPRNVNALPGSGYVAGIQPNTHRAPSQQSQVQNMVSQSTPSFIQQRGQGSFAFGGGLGQHQSGATLQQQQPQSSSHQQQQANGTSTSLPPHLVQTANIPNSQSVSSTSDVGLDPNDFPALGSTPTNPSTGSNGVAAGGSVTTSYASQAGTGVPLGGAGAGTIGAGAGGSTTQSRDFTPDDFPALGGQSQTQGQSLNGHNQSSSQDNQSHPPGLNGFQHSDPSQQQHRQNLLGALGGSLQSGTPGMLNLGQARSVHPGFQQGQTEAEKQQHRVHAWNSPNANPSAQSQETDSLTAFSNRSQTPSTQSHQNGHALTSTTHLNAPPGVPPPPYTHATTTASASGQPHYASNGAPGESNLPTNSSNPAPHPNPVPLRSTSIPHAQHHPQTPAQQVLVSAADRWGLLGLLAMLKNVGTDLDQGMSGIGTDLGTMGLDMGYSG
ncbi:hypothetical protein H0H81_008913 [Sphagnurus paluster]|uniref:Uncharacterized protein n=1 Tax=Sphagnurus paluster TaxID=117069 RepID=A0A9P7K461_9AGAR|nr:hypothetical protein H0H81_008913 [Sphagnurus paluster]